MSEGIKFIVDDAEFECWKGHKQVGRFFMTYHDWNKKNFIESNSLCRQCIADFVNENFSTIEKKPASSG